MTRLKLLLRLKIFVPFLLSALFLYIAFQDINLNELWKSLRSASMVTIVLASALAIMAILFRAWRWQFLLRPLKNLPYKRVYPITMIGFMANNILPAHAGELVRAYILAREEKIDGVATFTTVLLERILDLVALVSILAIVAYSVELPDWLRYSAFALGFFAWATLGVLYATTLKNSRLKGFLTGLVERLPIKVRGYLQAKLHAVLEGVKIVGSRRVLAKLMVMSLAVWLQLAFTIWVVLVGYPLENPQPSFILPALTALLLVAFAAAIPSSPGYVGVTQVAFVYALEPFGIGQAEAVGVSVVYHLTQYFPITLAGIWYLLRLGFSFRTLTEAREK
ncbi:MAG: lysylphosphatidylglycerol synthase transmembrane domain-containing protein [Calditrichia bacterium]